MTEENVVDSKESTSGEGSGAKVSNGSDEKETPWIDAWIRWERDSKDIVDDDDSKDEDEGQKEEDEEAIPTESYAFQYPLPPLLSGSKAQPTFINIELKGYPSESEQIWNSTGLTLWRSSHYLCEYLIEHCEELCTNKAVLEVGSGLGRCGILAHKLGARHVYCTDGDTDTLKQLRANILHNCTTTSSTPTDTSNENRTISCHQLLWGTETTTKFIENYRLTKKDDDDDDGATRGFVDVIIGSDLIYVPQVILPLFETISLFLQKNPKALFLMAHCSRRVGNEVTEDMIIEAATRNNNLHYEIVLDEIEDISIYKFQLTAAKLGKNEC